MEIQNFRKSIFKSAGYCRRFAGFSGRREEKDCRVCRLYDSSPIANTISLNIGLNNLLQLLS